MAQSWFSILRRATFASLAAGLAPSLRAAPPAAPTGLTATTLGVNTFRLNWNDTSTDENLFRVQARFVGDTTWINLIDLTQNNGSGTGPLVFHVLLTGEFLAANLQFQMLAVKSGAPEQISTSNTANASTTPATATFLAPSGLSATATDGVITLSWNDNANSEWGYEVEGSADNGQSFTPVLVTNPNQTTGVTISGHTPSTPYQYRVRAYKKENPSTYSAYTAPVLITTQALNLRAPTNLVATRTNERDIGFTHQEANDAESGHLIEYRLAGSNEWFVVGTVGADVTSISPVTGFFDPGTPYEFRTRAFYLATTNFNDAVFSPDSNLASATTLFQAPSSLAATPQSDEDVSLTWIDNSSVEQGFAVQYREGSSGAFAHHGYAADNETSYTVTGLKAATTYEFRVLSAYAAAAPESRDEILLSGPSNTGTATTRDTLSDPIYVEAVVGRPFQHTITTTTLSTLTGSSVSNLPANLVYDSGTRTISGTATAGGVTEAAVQLTFANGWVLNTTLTLRVLQPPVTTGSPPAPALTPNQTATLPLGGLFADADSETAVRVDTTLGAMRLLLYNTATPLTVSNFMAYADAGDYVDTVFHRSVPGFVVQGGAFRPDPLTGPAAFTAVPTRPQVQNEPGLSSVRATVAMAKLGDQPDSATNQFFVNLRNNGPILNNQNGGFTVFGRVPLADMAVADTLATLPRGDYTVTIGTNAVPFASWPLTTASDTMVNTNTVRILSVTSIPVLSYQVVSNSAPGVVAATVNGSDLTLTPTGGGSATLLIRATDVDGLSVEREITVTVPQFFSAWAAGQNLPVGQEGAAGNPDGDRLTNFEEFAFLGDPNFGSDAQALRPVYAQSNQLWSAEFNLRKNAFLDYSVWTGDTLPTNGWTRVWNSRADGLVSPVVVFQADLGTHLRLRVRDPQGSSSNLRFMALEVREP